MNASRWITLLPLVAACGGSGRADPIAATVTFFTADTGLSTCGSAPWMTGSSLIAEASFQRDCHGFFGFGDTCPALTDLTLSLLGDGDVWTAPGPSVAVAGQPDLVQLRIDSIKAGEANLVPSGGGQTFASTKALAVAPSSLVLRRSEFAQEGLPPMIALGGWVEITAQAGSTADEKLCGNALITLIRPSPGLRVKATTDSGTEAVAPRITRPLRVTALSAGPGQRVEVELGSLTTAATFDVILPVEVDSISPTLTEGRHIRLRASARGQDVAGMEFDVTNLTPELTAMTGEDTSGNLRTRAPLALLFAKSGASGMVRVRVKAIGSPAPEQMVTFAVP